MFEHIEEEGIIPSSTFELAAQGRFGVGMSASDIERQALEQGDVGGAIVLAISGEVFIEHDIERPVQAVFDGPVLADDAQGLAAAVALAHQEVTLDCPCRACW